MLPQTGFKGGGGERGSRGFARTKRIRFVVGLNILPKEHLKQFFTFTVMHQLSFTKTDRLTELIDMAVFW